MSPHIWVCYFEDETLKDVVWCRDCGQHRVDATEGCDGGESLFREEVERRAGATREEMLEKLDRAVYQSETDELLRRILGDAP